MNGQLVSKTRIYECQWHWNRESQSWLDSADLRFHYRLEDGSYSQETAPIRKKIRPPVRFLDELKRWRHFLSKHPMDDFQLRYQTKWIYLAGPPPRRKTLHQWTVHLHIPSRQLGMVMMTHRFRSQTMPGRRLRDRIVQLGRIPPLSPKAHALGSIVIDGDMFLQFVAPALKHLVQNGRGSGAWQELSAHKGPAAMQSALETGNPEIQPKIMRFRPHQITSGGQATWHALAYDANKQTLVCRKLESPFSYRALLLAQPLYRYFGNMTFGSPWQSGIHQGIDYQMPRVFLDF